MMRVADREVIEQLRKQIQILEGNTSPDKLQLKPLGLGPIESAFQDHIFAQGAIHELISSSSEDATCTSGFLAVLLGKLMQQERSCLWISTVPRQSIYPPALKAFGVDPERILFFEYPTPKATLWAIEEALKCAALPAVVGELNELSFNESRRLQLAAEQSQVTGFIHRFRPKTENALACVTRWKVSPLPGELPDGKPGLGFPRWNIDLKKIKNGRPRSWKVQWSETGLEYLQPTIPQTYERKTG